MSFNQFSFRFVFGIFALLAIVGLFNRIVDPFWYYRDIEIAGFNSIKTKFVRYERHVKPALLVRDQPQAIVLGNSFSEVGFDSTNPVFTDHGRLKSMNFALAGAPWEMVQCEFEFAVSHASIRRVLVGFTPGNLPLANCAKDFASVGQVSTMQLLFSDRALQASMETVRDQKNKMPSHTREGTYFMSHLKAGAHNRFREMFIQKIRKYQQTKENIQCLKLLGTSGTPAKLSSVKQLDLAGLRHIVRIAQDRDVELVLFVYPMHAYMLELVRQCEDQREQWQAMKQISDLVDTESVKDGQVRVYQFFGYNDITAEPVGESSAQYWQDPMHFTSEMGNLMLADMFGGNVPKLGRPLSRTSIDADYRDFLRGRTEYLQHHPEFQVDMQKLLRIQ